MTSEVGGYDLIPSNRELAGAEVELVEVAQRESQLRNALRAVDAQYDYVFLDCPPALNLLTVNALVAAHAVLIPMQCEYYALEGLSDLVETLKRATDLIVDVESSFWMSTDPALFNVCINYNVSPPPPPNVW